MVSALSQEDRWESPTLRSSLQGAPTGTLMTMSPTSTPGLGDPWFETLMDLSHGQFPSKEGLAFGLRSNAPVPVEVREFLARLVSGEVARPKGRPKRSWLERELIGMYIRNTHEFIEELMVEEQATGAVLGDKPSEIALIRTQEMLASEGEHRSVDSIRDIVGERNGWEGAVSKS